jgi:hypothetical protein
LGVELFESDPQLIDSFALRHASFLREITDGPHLRDAQRLLNELAAARRCLLNPQQKSAYDAELQERLATDKRLPDEDATTMAQATEPAAEPAADTRRRRSPSPGDVPVIAITPRNESRTSAGGTGSRRSRSKSTHVLSGTGAKLPRGSAQRTSSFARWARVTHVVTSGTGWLASRGVKRPVWLLAGGFAVLFLAIGVGAVVLFRAEPPRPAALARTAPEQPAAAGASVAEQEPLAEPLPEPSAEPAGDDSPAAVSIDASDIEPPVAVAMNPGTEPETEIPPMPSGFIPDGQPPRLAGLALWLDASQLAASNGRIARWSTADGGNYVAQPKQSRQQPELFAEALGGKNVVRFRGGQRLEIPRTSQALNLGSDYTIAYVARGVAGTLLSKGIGDKAGQFSLQSDSCLRTNGELNAASGGRLQAADDDPTLFRVRTIAADATALSWFLDGTASGSYSDERYDIQSTAVLWIGSPWFRAGQEDPTQFFVGDLAELVIYDRALPEDERLGVEAYLRDKWLATDQPAAVLDLVPPTVSTPAIPPPAEEQPAWAADRASSDDESAAASEPAAAEPAAAASERAEPAGSELFHLFVNLGGGAWQDPAGHSWVPSKKFDGATFGHEAGQSIKSDAVEHPMYSTAVRGLVGFRALVPNGDYAIEMHFHEHWSRNPTDRAFFVAIEQVPVLRPPMFFQGPGMGQPYVHKIGKVTVKDGRLDVDFGGVQPGSLAILNGIAIRQLR